MGRMLQVYDRYDIKPGADGDREVEQEDTGMNDYVTVSFSGGKDSTAMLLHMMEIGEHIDEVINVDTGMEFPSMYEHIEKIRKEVEDNGIRFTILRAEHTFEWFMFEKPIGSEKYGPHNGFGWPTHIIRWCTKHLKTKLIDNYFKELSQDHNVIRCVGLAADELKRLERTWNQEHRHPLVEWGWSEDDCLEYCYSRGYDWGGLYDLFNRVSCWCCPLAPISELRKLWANYPDLWEKLEQWDDRMIKEHPTYQAFKGDYSVRSLSLRFEKEAIAERNQSKLDAYGVIE